MAKKSSTDTKNGSAPNKVESSSSTTAAAIKKRKRSTSPKQKTSEDKHPATSLLIKTPPPSRILVIDNGGDTIKYGWSTDEKPSRIPNVTARLQQQWTVLAGDQLSQIRNPNQLVGLTRSTERGIITNLGNQVQVWKRILDLLGVIIPLTTETAEALGWRLAARSAAKKTFKPPSIPALTCAVLISVDPQCPRSLMDQITQIWLDDFGFGHIGLASSGALLAKRVSQSPSRSLSSLPTCCVVDMGWSSTVVTPALSIDQMPIVMNAKAVRRLSVGGRHLINLWKYYCTYRQWNLMDQEFLLRDVLEQAAFVSLQVLDDLKIAQSVPAGRRPFDREFVMPDFDTTFKGRVQLPLALQQAKEDEDNESDDEDVDDKEMEAQAEESEDDGDSDPEESIAARRRQLLQERAAEARRLREQQAEQQVLNLSVERFLVPETLFRPADSGLFVDWAGLPATIVQSIGACPKIYQASLYKTIHLVGGLSQLPGLTKRLETEIRMLAPCEYEVGISVSESPVEDSWYGACSLATDCVYSTWSLSSEDWAAMAKRGVWKKLSSPEKGGGVLL